MDILQYVDKTTFKDTLVYQVKIQDDNIDNAITASRLIDAICGRKFIKMF